MPTVGIVSLATHRSAAASAEPFVRYMKELGWDEGRNYRLLFLGAEGHSDRFPDLVKNLFAQRVYVLVALGNAAIDAAKHASTTIPIVGMTDDMVRSALAASMAQPAATPQA